jgi:hypothetical protein
MRLPSIMEFGTGLDDALKAVGEVVRIQKKSHELGESIDLGVIAVNESKLRFLGALSVGQCDGCGIRCGQSRLGISLESRGLAEGCE